MAESMVLILPGAGDPPAAWSSVETAVHASGVRCEVLAYPMMGGNTEPQPVSIEEYAKWVLAEIERRDLSNLVVAGHSMGALIALEVCATGSPHVKGIIVMCPAEPMFVHPSLLEKAEQDQAEAVSMISRWSYSHESRQSLASVIAAHAARTAALEPGVLAANLHACNNYTNASAAASRIDTPATVILSGDDHMTPRASADPIVDNLSDVVVHVLDGAGHAIEHERPDDVAAIIVSAATPKATADPIGTR